MKIKDGYYTSLVRSIITVFILLTVRAVKSVADSVSLNDIFALIHK